MKIQIILCAFLIVPFSCSNSVVKSSQNSSTGSYEDSIVDERLLSWYFLAQEKNGTIYADSAIALADSMIHKYPADSQKQLKYILQRMNFLILKKKYEEAISVMYKSDNKKWDIGGVYFKDILKYRILAMQAKELNDERKYKEALNNALSLTKKYISENQKEYDACIATELRTQKGKYIVITYQYVFYNYLLYGKEATDNIIEDMKVKYDLNESAIESLKNKYYAEIDVFYII